MTEGDAVLVGGPADGTAFTAEDAGLVELEYGAEHAADRLASPLTRDEEETE